MTDYDGIEYIESAENLLAALKIYLIEARAPEGDEEIVQSFDGLLDNLRLTVEQNGPLSFEFSGRGVEIRFRLGLHVPDWDDL